MAQMNADFGVIANGRRDPSNEALRAFQAGRISVFICAICGPPSLVFRPEAPGEKSKKPRFPEALFYQ